MALRAVFLPNHRVSMTYQITVETANAQFPAEADESILAAAARAGLVFPYNCRNGVCGTCMAQCVSGAFVYPSEEADGERPRGISEAAHAQGQVLLCQAQARSDLTLIAQPVDAVADFDIRTLPARVESLTRLAHDVMRVRLRLGGGRAVDYLPGQYLEVLLKDGRTRAFSMATPPDPEGLLELHIRHVPGGVFSTEVFETMAPKQILRVRLPLGTFFLREDQPRPALLVAGGTGFAPLQAVMTDALARNLGRPLHLFWGVRDRPDLYLAAVPQAWAAEQAAVQFTPVLSEPSPDSGWQGETGFVHQAVLRAYPDLSRFDAYLCGPPPMIDAARDAFIAAGLPADRLFFDAFDYAAEAEG